MTGPERVCRCVAEHSPEPRELHTHHVLPLSWGGRREPANEVLLCPTSHSNTHHLLDAYVRAGGDPGWPVRRRYSRVVRSLAARAWTQRPPTPTYTLSEV